MKSGLGNLTMSSQPQTALSPCLFRASGIPQQKAGSASQTPDVLCQAPITQVTPNWRQEWEWTGELSLSQIQIHKYKYSNTNTQIQVHKWPNRRQEWEFASLSVIAGMVIGIGYHGSYFEFAVRTDTDTDTGQHFCISVQVLECFPPCPHTPLCQVEGA